MPDFQLILLRERKRPHPQRRGANALVQNQSHDAVVVPLIVRSGELPAPAPDGWLKPGEALARVQEAMGGDRVMAIATIIGRLKAKQLHAHFENYEWGGVAKPPTLGSNFIEPKFWEHYKSSSDSAYVWVSSDLRLYLGNYFHEYYQTDVTITFFRVTLDADGIDEIVANATVPARRNGAIKKSKDDSPSAPEPDIKLNKGGRPAKDFWDDLWIEVCAHIHENGIPNKQSEIENAMLDWAAKNAHELSISSVRPRARKLLDRLRKS